MTRSKAGHELLDSLGARSIEADVFDEASLTGAFDAAEAVVNLLTHIPPPDRMSEPSAWDENDRPPPSNAEIDAALAAAAGVDGLRSRAPQDGPMARSQRVSNRRLREASDWAPQLRAGTEVWRQVAN